MRRHTVFHNYYRYYGCFYYRMMTSNDSSHPTWYNDVVISCWVATVITTVVCDSNKDSSYGKSYGDACDFYSHVGCAMSGTVFKKNRPSWTMTTRRSVQHTLVQKRSQPSNDKRAFSLVCHRRRDSWNVSGTHEVLSHRRNPSKPHVSRTEVACGDDSSGEMQL